MLIFCNVLKCEDNRFIEDSRGEVMTAQSGIEKNRIIYLQKMPLHGRQSVLTVFKKAVRFFSMIPLFDGSMLATSSEGGVIELWRVLASEGETVVPEIGVAGKPLTVPAESLWSLAQLTNGDLVCAARLVLITADYTY